MAKTMKAAAKSKARSMSRKRYDELRKMLEDRRRTLMEQIQDHRRNVRAGDKGEVRDAEETADDGAQEDILLTLAQMKSETLQKIEAALRRLEEGTYGDCRECGKEISEARLWALAFAVRCKDCEDARETVEHRVRHQGKKLAFVSGALFDDDRTRD